MTNGKQEIKEDGTQHSYDTQFQHLRARKDHWRHPGCEY